MKSSKSIFTCQSCGYQTPKWMGKCPDCDSWDTLVEEISASRSFGKSISAVTGAAHQPVPIDSVEIEQDVRLMTGIGELAAHSGMSLIICRDRNKPSLP